MDAAEERARDAEAAWLEMERRELGASARTPTSPARAVGVVALMGSMEPICHEGS